MTFTSRREILLGQPMRCLRQQHRRSGLQSVIKGCSCCAADAVMLHVSGRCSYVACYCWQARRRPQAKKEWLLTSCRQHHAEDSRHQQKPVRAHHLGTQLSRLHAQSQLGVSTAGQSQQLWAARKGCMRGQLPVKGRGACVGSCPAGADVRSLVPAVDR